MKRSSMMCLVVALSLFAGAGSADAARIKDITSIEGIRSNQLYGVGLVIGLAGTGSGSDFTNRMAANMLARMRVGRGLEELDGDNMSAVMVTAELPAFARKGTRIDITVSTLDEATSLRGGTLVMVPLIGADGKVYAVAQGAVAVGGFSFGGAATTVSQGHATVGRIPGGATVEKTVRMDFLKEGAFTLCLGKPDFATVRRLTEVIAKQGGGVICTVADAGNVRVRLPKGLTLTEQLAAVARIQLLEIEPDAVAVVVINEKTGTVVAGQNVGIAQVAISHGNLTVVTKERPMVSQPQPLSTGDTVVVPRTDVVVVEKPVGPGGLAVVSGGSTVADVARALNALGAGPRDIISIFQAIKEAGALHAELRVM